MALDLVGRALDEASELAVPPKRTVLLGFSQGASVAVEFALTRPRRSGGVVALSGGALGENAKRGFEGSLTGRRPSSASVQTTSA